ncbi:MMPL family transporter [Corynebacterium poyangense]|uniref:MMPL family transporter n=1 Tax=Corynebacterium poyangense TaxID=2684405 RepID=A0A7H0SRM1_9CORY|nr:MMPL family transporter [Corynebacterium poyangense]MBZ8176627.1 MMPL family transporter [Corynebacterium poyangense]QNQ91196.1 MMPL family transporter [Corynebacterium poyangense]
MFEKWGYFAYRHRRIIPIVIVVAVLALYGVLGTRLAERMSQEGWDDPGSASTQAAQIEEETFGRDNNGDVILLFHSPSDRTLDDPRTFGAAQEHLRNIAELPQVDHVTSYFDTRNVQLINQDHTEAFAALGLKGDGEQTLKDFRAIKDQLVGELPGGTTIQVAGATAVADALDEGMAGDIHRAEIYALPAVGLLLLIVFGSVVAAAMPLIVGVLSILGSLGVLSFLAGFTQVNIFAQSVVTLLGLGLAIDYGLFMVSRFREEMDKGIKVETAVAITTATAGKTVVFSAAMVAVALSSLFVFPQAFLKSVAYGAISAVGLAALLSLTVLPSIFSMLGKNIDRWAVRRTSRKARRLEDTFWYRLPAWAMKHAKVSTVVVAGVLVALAIPLVGVTFGGINETYLPPKNETRVAQDDFNDTFPAFRTEPVKLVVTNADNRQLVQIYQQANAVEGLTGRFSASSTKNGTTVLSAGIQDRSLNQHVVEQLRNISTPEGVKMYVGGTPALEVESIEALLNKLPWMALYVVIATFVLMSLVFGSLVLPAKAIIMTVLGMGATLGILTLMFVDGLGADLLNFTAGPLMSPILVLLLAIMYGLSTDYEVFLVSRMVEARDRKASTDQAIKYGTAHTGHIITAAALIMIVVCGAFGFSEIVMMKYIAFGMIAALFLDATVIRMFLVPAVMHLLREDNWWAPRFIRTAYAHLGHGEQVPEPRAEYVPAARPHPEPAAAAQPVSSSSEPAPESPPADPCPDWHEEDEGIYEAEIVEDHETSRHGRRARDDDELIPFSELMRRLEIEQQTRNELE